MRKFFPFIILALFFSCTKQQVHPPVGGILNEKDLDISKNRAKSLNEMERSQISDWIAGQKERFYPMKLNYWASLPLDENPKKGDGEVISYEYTLYDFDQKQLYEAPKKMQNVSFGKFEELKAVEDALRHMEKNQEVTLLIPSVLAFGTYGDNKKIPNDMPVMVKLKTN